MKVHSDLLKKLVKKASLNGKIQTINLLFSKEGVTSSVRDIMNTVMTKVSLDKEAFTDYIPLGEVYIKDSIMLMKFLDTFKDDIEVSLNEDCTNLVLMSDERTVEVILGSEIVCDNVAREDFPDIKYDAKFECRPETLMKTANDYNLLKAVCLEVSVKDKKVKLTVGKSKNEDSLTNFFNVECENKVTTTYGDAFINAISVLDNDVTISLSTNKPIFIEEKKFNHYKFSCIVAPIVNEE